MQYLARIGFVLLTTFLMARTAVAQDAVQWRIEDGGNGHWYLIENSQPLSWDDASNQAAAIGGVLVCLESAEEQSWVFDFAEQQSFWLGLYQDPDTGEPNEDWQWLSGAPLSYENWDTGEPNESAGAVEDRAQVLETIGTWNDLIGDVTQAQSAEIATIIEWSADCNGDGIVDYGQILDGTLLDEDGNGIPDVCDQPGGFDGILDVPSEYDTIQEAIDAAADGTRIAVAPGVYAENLSQDGTSFILEGSVDEDGNILTTIDGGGVTSTIVTGGGGAPVFRNLRITNGYREVDGGGMRVTNDAVFEHCIITDNITEWRGGGVFAAHESPVFDRCLITGNDALGLNGEFGDQFVSYDGGNPTISNSVICGGDEAFRLVFGGTWSDGGGNVISNACPTTDCDENGLPDLEEALAGNIVDRNLNFIPDACEPDCDDDGVIDDLETDCDGNGIPDDCDLTDAFSASEPRTPINTDDVIEFDVSGMADAADSVTVTVSALGDYQAIGSLLILELVSETGSTFSEILFGFDGEDCTVMSTTLQIPAADWNQSGLNGDRMIEISGTSIQPTLCEPDRFTAITVEVPIAFLDCNDNGLWDACEVSDGSALDSDGDGLIDDCDGCPNDPEKTAEGLCDCGTPDTDSDADGTPDCIDPCPDWPHACSEDGQTLFVSVDQSIQGAIDAVPAGGVISLNEGTFTLTTSLDPGGKDIILRGQVDGNGDPTSILDGQNGCRVMDITNGETLNTVLENLVFRNGDPGPGEDDHGGAIRLFNSDATIRHCRFEQNQSTNYGGAIVIHDDDAQSETTIENCVFTNNRSVDGAVPSGVGGRGGAIAIYRGDPTIIGCTFTGNIAEDEGGAIHSNQADPAVTNCDFIENTASQGKGGGFFGWQSSPNLSNCLFLMNESNSDGAGAGFDSLGDVGNPVFTGCTFRDNMILGPAGGGGLYCTNNSPTTITDCLFEGNSAVNGGGGIHSYNSNLTIQTTDFLENSSSDTGGAIYLRESDITFIDCLFNGNESEENGGGLWMYLGSLTATDCTFSDNTANNGGGISARNLAQFSLENCTLNTNTAHGSYGGAIFNEASTLSLENCVVDGNTASSNGGAVYNNGATTNATNTHFESNESNSEGGAIWWNNGGAGTLVQCDFINNRVTDGNGGNKTGGALWYTGSAITATNCAFQGNAAPGSGGAIFQLPNSSPAIVLTDNTICDNSSPQISGGFTDAGNCITDTCDSDLDGTLDCFDGCPDDPDKTEPGVCDCGTADTDTDADGLADCVDPCPEWPNVCSEDGQTLFVAVGESIQNAINLVPAGGTVEIAAGSFQPGAPLDTQGRPMTIIGAPLDADGLPTTILDGQQTHRVLQCVSGEGPETVFENLWITGGAAIAETAPEYRGGGMYNEGSSPTLRFCWFVNNASSNDGGGMANYLSSSPTLETCVFIDNTARFGGGLANSNESSPLLSDCTVENNEAIISGGGLYSEVASTPELIDSVVCGNLADQIAGGYDDLGGNCILEDCGTDLDANGVPDACDPDCNNDGTPDGLETDCDGDGIPDDCAITDGVVEDCNANGIPDTCDITDGTDADVNANDVPDDCEYRTGDLNLDGCIDGSDLATLLALWGLSNPPVGDLNGDGIVAGQDLATLLANWEPCP